MIGTSDQSCWLAEACKILLLLLPTHYQTKPMQVPDKYLTKAFQELEAVLTGGP